MYELTVDVKHHRVIFSTDWFGYHKMSPAIEQSIRRQTGKQLNPTTGVIKSHGVSQNKKQMTSKPKRKVMLVGKRKLIGSTSDSSGTTEQTYRSASPRLINRIETQNPTSKAEPIRYVGHPIKTSVPFNRMLSTSTPDPEKCLTTVNWTDCDAVEARLASNTPNQLPERKKSKKLMQTNKVKVIPATVKQCKTDRILRKQKSPTNIKKNVIQQKKKTHSDAANPETSLRVGVLSSSPSYGNAYSFSVHQVNKMSPKLDTVNNRSAFDPVVPSSKHEWKDTTNTSNTTKVLNPVSQCITSSNSQKPVLESIPLTSTESDAPNLDSRQVPSYAKEQSIYYPPNLLNYKPPEYPGKSTNTAETRNQTPIQKPLQLIPECPTFLDKTVQTNQNRASQSKEQLFAGIDPIKDKLQTSVPVSTSNYEILPPVSSHFFTPINPPQGSVANVRVSFEEPVRDNNIPGYSAQLNQPKTVPFCSNNLNSNNSNPAEKSLKECQGNIRNGSNDTASPLELCKTTKNHHTSPGINYKETPYTYGYPSNSYDIHLQWQSVEALARAKTLKFIINELKETCQSTNHREIIRMVTRLEDLVNTLPQLQDTFDLQTEFCLALQPLRTENNRLHKSLRMLAEEKAQMEKKMEEDHRREILELQLQLLTLEKHVDEEKLQNQLQLHHHEHVIKDLKNEQECLVKDLGKRDNSQLNMRLKDWEENQMLSLTIQENKDQLAKNVHNLEVSEKKNHILQLTVEQRDREITNLHGVLHSVRKAMQDVLENIDPLKGNTFSTDTLGRFFELFSNETDPECSSSMLSACSTSKLMLAESQKVSSNVAIGNENPSSVTPKGSVSEQSVDQRLQALLKTMTSASNKVVNPVGCTNDMANSFKPNQTGDISMNAFELPSCFMFESKGLINQQNRLYNYRAETEEFNCLKDNGQQFKPDRDNDSCLSSKLEHSFDSQNKMEISNDSRASITDYFQKYPRAKAVKGLVGPDSKSINNYETERAQPLSVLKNMATFSPAKEICCDSDGKGKTDNTNGYHNVDDEDTISNLSQYTINTDSSLNADILNFRNGLASLDADIAQLEQSIKETK